MKIFITTHGDYEWNHISLCTTDFEKAVAHFLEYSRTAWYNSMSNMDIWEDNKEYHSYGSWNGDLINCGRNKSITLDELRDDILLSLKKAGKRL